MTKSVKQKIGFKIKSIRERLGITRATLAERLAVSVNYIYKIEAGIGGFSIKTMTKIADALAVDVAVFYDWREESSGTERVKDIELPYGKKLEDRIVELIQETIQRQISAPSLPVETGVEEIAKLLLQLPVEKQKKIIDRVLAEKFRN